MTYKDANNTIKHVLHTDVAYPGLQPQVQGGKDQWADIKPATDITSLNMRVLNYRSRQVLIKWGRTGSFSSCSHDLTKEMKSDCFCVYILQKRCQQQIQ